MRKYYALVRVSIEDGDITNSESIYSELFQESISEEEKENLRKEFVSSELAWCSESFSGFSVMYVKHEGESNEIKS